jgi:DNA-binding transcriptional regulator YdaS (Cro superfamily)
MNAIERAIEIVGGPSALASKLGTFPSVVGNWKLRKRAPAGRCVEIENATNGQVTRYDLRPDVFGKAAA